MSSKEEILKMLGNLSLDELYETQNCINSLIARLESSQNQKGFKEASNMVNKPPDLLRQERLYEIFTCKFKKTGELEKPPSSGIVVDISKGGLRLKTNRKIKVGDILVIFHKKLQKTDSLAILPDYDNLHKKIFVEVIRVKEFMEFYEVGCKFLPLNSQLHNFII